MGEYAKRISDGERVKIGTCEDMYYLRYEDRFKIAPLSGNVDPAGDPVGLRFRLPFRDEDGIEPGGNYQDYQRGVRLAKPTPCAFCQGTGKSQFESDGLCRRCHGAGHEGHSDFEDPETLDDPGTIQLHHKSGLLLNVQCFHGQKLPNVGDDAKAFWNGKGWSTELSSIKAIHDGSSTRIVPIVRCIHCGRMYRYEWAQVWDYIDPHMQKRLEGYRQPSTVAA